MKTSRPPGAAMHKAVVRICYWGRIAVLFAFAWIWDRQGGRQAGSLYPSELIRPSPRGSSASGAWAVTTEKPANNNQHVLRLLSSRGKGINITPIGLYCRGLSKEKYRLV